MISIGVTSNIDEIIKIYEAKKENYEWAFYVAVLEECIEIMDMSLDLTPIDTGALRDSANMDVVIVPHQGMLVEFTYDLWYALYVHEMPYRHSIGQSKFLETAIAERSPGFMERVKQRMLTNNPKRLKYIGYKRTLKRKVKELMKKYKKINQRLVRS